MLLILLTLGTVSVLGVVPPSHAAGTTISITTLNGSTVCTGSLGGTWVFAVKTCTVTGTLAITSVTTLDIGAGVTIIGNGGYGGDGIFYGDNGGTGISNLGTIINEGTVIATGGPGGESSEGDGGDGGTGISNLGTIINEGTVIGTGGNGGRGLGLWGTGGNGGTGISNLGTIINEGTVIGTGGHGRVGTWKNGGPGPGIFNGFAINDYCGVTVSSSPALGGNTPNAISCYTVTFDQSGIPSGVTWGVTASWGPFVLPVDHTGTGGSIAINATGSLTYSYDTPAAAGVTYVCQSGCSGTAAVSGATSFSATFYPTSAPAISIDTSNGSSVCPAGELDGTWSADTCTVPGTLIIVGEMTLDIGAGVTVTASGGIINAGSINNYGIMIGSSVVYSIDYERYWGVGIFNAGSINNYGTMSGSGSVYGTNYEGSWGGGIFNAGTINNAGTMTGSGDLRGIINAGTINNYGTMTGNGYYYGINNYGTMTGSGYYSGIITDGTINNAGTMTVSGGIDNTGATFNDYCGVTVTFNIPNAGLWGNTPNAISCYTVTFDQSGIPSGVTWGVTASWGPFVLPVDHTGTGGSIAINATGSLTYSYDSPVAGSGVTYVCQSGCSGTAAVSGATSFSATYFSTSPTGVPQFPLGIALLFALVVPALLVLRKRASALGGLAR